MWEKNKWNTECDKNTITCDVSTAQCENDTIECEKQNKGTTECDKSTVTCDVSITQCEDGNIKCVVLVTWYSRLPTSEYCTQKKGEYGKITPKWDVIFIVFLEDTIEVNYA